MLSPNSIPISRRAASSRKRLVLVLASVFGGLAATVAFVVFDAWIEVRYSSKGAVSIIAEPVGSVSGQVSACTQKRFEIAYIYPSLSLEEILRRFSDARIDPAERRLFAYRLA